MINTTNEGSKLYLYSITSVAILGGLLFGYDTAVISGAEKGLEAFFLSASDFQYNKVMHGITSSSALIGCVLGGALSGIFASRLGRRNSLRLAAVLFFLSALGSYYPEVLFFEYGKPNMDLLIAFNLYRVLGGIGVGLASAVCPMYIAEIAPSNIRGTLVSCNQFAIIFGMLVVYFVNFLIMGDHQNPIILKDAAGVLSVSAESDMWTVYEGWRYMFGSEAFPAAFFGLLLFFVPKTPRYLVLIQQDEKAYSILEKINGKTKAQEILNDIKATAHEKTEKIFTYGVAVIVIGILLSVFQQGGVYLAMKKIGKNNPKAEEIKADNAARQEWNRTVDVALVEGVPEEDILKIKQEKITDETLQSIRTHGWLPDMFRQIIRGAKDFLQEVIFKFKLPPRTVPKIDLQEWKDMQKLMYELQGQSREIKRTQQDISSLKKQLSELRGLFKGKERKSLEGKIELLEDLEKRLHRSMGRIVKREGYPNVQSFQKVYNKAEELIMEYNEELRAWKNQTKPKKENPLEQPQKASVLEKLHRYQQEGRQQPKRSVKKKSMDRER